MGGTAPALPGPLGFRRTGRRPGARPRRAGPRKSRRIAAKVGHGRGPPPPLPHAGARRPRARRRRMEHGMLEWGAFGALVLAMLALDLGVFHRKDHEIGAREALGWSAFWAALALAFGGYVWVRHGAGP